MINSISEVEKNNISAEEWEREEAEYRALLTDESLYWDKLEEKKEELEWQNESIEDELPF